MGEPQPVKISLTPKPGVNYEDGILHHLDPSVISIISEAISNNTAITADTTQLYVDYNDLHHKLNLGTLLDVTGVEYSLYMEIIGFNHDILSNNAAYGKPNKSGKAGITFCCKDIFYNEAMNTSATNIGGWQQCKIRQTLSNLEENLYPDGAGKFQYDWRPFIKSVNKKTSVGNSLEDIETTEDKLFLLSEVEVFGSITYSVPGEGMQYAYYKAGNSKVKEMQGSAYYWWERSPGSGGSSRFCCVNSNGNAVFNYADFSNGVAFAFCI